MPTFRVPTERGTFDVVTDAENPTPEQLLDLVNRSMGGGEAGGGEADAEDPGLVRSLAALGVRIAGPVVGAGLAGVAALPTGPGAIGAAAAGGAAGGALGEVLAETIEGREEFSPGEIAAQTVVGAIPGVGPAAAGVKSVAGRALFRAGEGAVQGALANAITETGQTAELPSASAFVKGAVVGGALSPLLGRGIDKLAGRKAAAGLAQIGPPAPTAPPSLDDVVTSVTKGRTSPFTRVGVIDADPIPGAGTRPASRMDELADEYVARVYADNSQEARDVLTRIYRDNPDLVEKHTRGTQSHARTQALSERIVFSPEDVVPGTAANAEQGVAASNLVAELSERSAGIWQELSANPGDKALEAALLKTHADLVDASLAVSGLRAEAGRALNAYQIKANREVPTNVRFIKAANAYGASKDDIVAALNRAGDDPLRQYRELVNIARASNPGAGAKLQSLYITNLLTNPKTLERNLFGNFLRVAQDVPGKAVGSGIDALRSAVTGAPRQVFLREAGISAASAWKAVPEAGRAFYQIMRQGFSDEQALNMILDHGKFDIPTEFTGRFAPLLNIVPRILNGTDAYFRTLGAAMARNTGAYARAVHKAQSEGLTGSAASKRIAEIAADLATNPTPDLLGEIEEAAARSVFREGSEFAAALNNLIDKAPLPIKVGMKIVMPFIRTPANIIKQGFAMSPAGFAMREAREGGRLGNQAQAFAAMGSLLMVPLVHLAATDQLTGSAPNDDAGKRDAFLAEHPENSVRIGDTWYQFTDLGPLAIPMGVIANAIGAYKDAEVDVTDADVKTLTTKVVAAMGQVGQSLFDASYLSGVGELLDAVQNPNQNGARFIQRRVTSFVPGQGLLRSATQVNDPVVRSPRSSAEAVRAIVPGLSTGVTPKLDAFGKPVERGDKGLRSLFIPTSQPALSDAMRAEIERLGIEVEPAKRQAEVKITKTRTVEVSKDADAAIREAKGRTTRFYVERAMATDIYQNANDVVRERIIKRAIKRAGSFVAARAKFRLARNQPVLVEGLVPIALLED